MVLSNKKLKGKLRTLVSDSITASESSKPIKNSSENEELNSIKEILGSKTKKKPKPAKERKKKKVSEEGGQERQQSKGSRKSEKQRLREIYEEELNERRKVRLECKRMKKEEKKIRKAEERRKREEEEKNKGEGGRIEDGGKESGGGEYEYEGGVEEEEEEPMKIHGDEKRLEEEPTQVGVVDESEMKKIYVGGIPYYSSEDDITSFFESCGTITEMDCMTFPETGKFRGIAFLTFKTGAAAKRALALDGADMGGFYLKIQPYKAQRTQEKSDFAPELVDGYNRAYVGNLSWDITEDDLKQFFSDCKISSIRFGMDKETGDFKGYAHIDFSDSVSLAVALKLDQKVVCGRPVRIRCAVPKKAEETSSGKKRTTPTNVENDGSGGGKKKKRRTCYECGVPGHLSSACPQKKSARSEVNVTES